MSTPTSRIELRGEDRAELYTAIAITILLVLGIASTMGYMSIPAILLLGLAVIAFFLSFKKVPPLVIENGLIRSPQVSVIVANRVDTMAINDIIKISIFPEPIRILVGAPRGMLLTDNNGKNLSYDILFFSKKDLVNLGQALTQSTAIRDSKEVQGFLRGDIIFYLGYSKSRVRKILFGILYAAIIFAVIVLIYDWSTGRLF